MDIAPLYDDMNFINNVDEDITHGRFEVLRPKIRNSTDSHSYLMLEPKSVDYRKPNDKSFANGLQMHMLRGEDPISFMGELSKEDFDMYKRLKKTNSREISQCEKRCFDLLVKIEKEISWDTLLKIKSCTFLVEEDNE